MNSTVPLKTQIVRALGKLTQEQLARLWQYLQELEREPATGLYALQEQAEPVGVTDLAENHAKYLYGPQAQDD
ncbi:MAG: hypothetical protein ACYC6L_03545 [Anaerolineae bacterium]